MAPINPTLFLFSLLTGLVSCIPMSILVQRLPQRVSIRIRQNAYLSLRQIPQVESVARLKPLPYPLALTGALGACMASLTYWVGFLYGAEWEASWALAFCATLVALSFIDARTYLLPDILTLPLLWMGLLYHLVWAPDVLSQSVLGIMSGYGLLWSINWCAKLITGKEGIGYGDIKLLAAIGAWVGISQIPLVFLLSSVMGTLVGLVLIIAGPHSQKGKQIPFGPFLSASGIMAFLGFDQLASILPWITF